MAQPTPYNRQFNFQDYQAQQPTSPLPGDEVDNELNAVKLTFDQTLVALAKIQRDDGALKNGNVTQDSLSNSLSIGFTFRGTWASGINYLISDGVAVGSIFYKAKSSHLSSGANQPPNATFWDAIADITPLAISPNSVSTAAIQNLAVTTAKLADGAVSTQKIVDANVTTAKIADGALSANATGRAKMAAGYIDALRLASSAVPARAGVLNGKIVQTRTGGAETFALKTLAGSDPSASDPALFVFQDGTGGFVVRTVTAALSVTASSGSTLGASNGAPFRIWIVAADDAGAVRLGIVKTTATSATSANVMSLAEWSAFSGTAEGGAGAADSAQVIYSDTAFTSKFICLVGFADWDSGLTTAGSWNSAPTRTVLFGPGVARPGEPTGNRRHVVLPGTFTSTTAGVLTDVTGLTVDITPGSGANLIRAVPRLQAFSDVNATAFALVRASANVGGGTAASNRVSAFGGTTRVSDGNSIQVVTAEIIDAPGATIATTYRVQFILQSPGRLDVNRTLTDTDAAGIGRFSSSLTLEEIMA
ncbi:hypothetical protein [Bosea sp. PAMC 26642]|uniref:hypothetical protein n=1 Tax=Bosea sp. (strain PAMC 26642) TaxID=1792307 RepID=UPI0007702FA4|nr:hypothetical protein [Bosea sp. PAMC 26642]AMJ61386.1 hypothetical protein AXW83_14760 [Bosea sp. PAMC 26642]